MTERTMRLWIGLFVLLSLVLFAGLIILFGSAPTLFKRSNLYAVRFTDAPGIGAGVPVRRSGVRIGEVRDVTLEEDQDDVKVTLAIDPKYTVRKNEEIRLTTGLLGSDTTIDFVPRPQEPGKPPIDRSPLPPGSELKGLRQPTVNSVLDQASGVVPTAQETLNDVRRSLQRLEKMAPQFEDTFREYRDLARSIRDTTMPSLNRTSDEYRELAKSVRESLPGITRTSDEIRELTKSARESLPEARRLGEDLGSAVRTWSKLGERADVLLQTNQDRISKALDSLSETLSRASGFLNEANQNNIAEFLKNARSGTNNLESISRNLEEITREGRASVKQLNNTLKRAEDVMKSLQGVSADVQPKQVSIDQPPKKDRIEKLDRPLPDDKAEPRPDDRIARTSRNLEEASARLNKLLGEIPPGRFGNISRNLEESTDKINKLVDKVPGDRITSISRNLDEGTAKINTILGQFPTERIESISRNLDDSLDKVNKILGDVREMVRAVGQADGTINRFLTDPTIYNRIDEAICMITRMTPRIERILKDFETFADKLARHPESIGIGGVVRPGSGLKDPPTMNSSHYQPVPMPQR